MDEITIEDGNNITRSQVYKGRHIVARFEESSIKPNQLPYYLYPTFQEILVTQKGCVQLNGFFDCSEKYIARRFYGDIRKMYRLYSGEGEEADDDAIQ